MDANETLRTADVIGLGWALTALDEALDTLDRAPDRDLTDWAELMHSKAFWLVQMQRPGEAVICASRLVDAVSGASAAVGPDLVSRSMARLVLAYAADGDLETAEMVAQLMSRRFPLSRTPSGLAAHLRARVMLDRCRRLLGEVDDAAADLSDIVADYGDASDRSTWVEATMARGELVLCMLELGDSEAAFDFGVPLAEDAVELDSPMTRSPLVEVCEALAGAARRAGRLAEAIRLSEAVLALLDKDRTLDGAPAHCRMTTNVVEMLTQLDRLPAAVALGERCFARYGSAEDSETVYQAAMAATASAQACLLLRDPRRAERLLERMPRVTDRTEPGAEEFAARLGLARAECAMQTGGAGAAMRAYSDLITTLGDSIDPKAQCLLADALERDGALRVSLGNGEQGVNRAHELMALWREFPAEADLTVIAESCNRLARALFANDQVAAAGEVARAVIDRQEELLGGSDPGVCVTAYTVLSDVLMFAKDPATLSEVWDGILGLGEPALLVLEGLAEHYRARDDLRVVLLYTYIGRTAVLTELGREAAAERVAEDLLLEFSNDDDEQIRQILREFRSRRPDSED